MGFSCCTITTSLSLSFLFSSLKSLQDFVFENLVRLNASTHTNNNNNPINTASLAEFRPSPSLVPLPIQLISKSHKNHLPIVQYMMIKPRLRAHDDNDDDEEEEADSCCPVCLSGIEPWHKVRKLGHCKHAFHVECLDSWTDLGRETCPVCRAKLLPGHGEEMELGKDPWRSERMVYLFGEDCLMRELE